MNLEEQETFISDKVRLLLKEQCEACKKVLYPKEILKMTSKVGEQEDTQGVSQFVFRCTCFEQIYPSLKVRIGDVSLSRSLSLASHVQAGGHDVDQPDTAEAVPRGTDAVGRLLQELRADHA